MEQFEHIAYKKLSELENGDKIYLYNKLTSQLLECKITNIIKKNKMDMLEIQFSDGVDEHGIVITDDSIDNSSVSAQNMIFSTYPIQ